MKAKTSNCNYAFFVTNGGSVDATKTGFAAVYREGYTAQWFETENFTGSPVTGTPATGKTYYAKWIEHIPEPPTEFDNEQLARMQVNVKCETDTAHAKICHFSELDGCYSTSEIMTDSNGGYYVTVTLNRSSVVEKFNKDEAAGGKTHDDTEPNAITSWTWTWDANDKVWSMDTAPTPDAWATIVVKCEPEPTTVNVYVGLVDSTGATLNTADFRSNDFGEEIVENRYHVGALTTTQTLSDLTADPNGDGLEENNPVKTFIYQQMAKYNPAPGYETNWTPAEGVAAYFKWARQIRFTELKKQDDGTYNLYGQIIAYKLSLDLDGGTLTEDTVSGYYLSGSEVTLPQPTKSGYKFLGWTKKEEPAPNPDGGAIYLAAMTAIDQPQEIEVSYDVTYIANWEKLPEPNVHFVFHLSSKLGDGEQIASVKYSGSKQIGETLDLTSAEFNPHVLLESIGKDFNFEVDAGWYNDGEFNEYRYNNNKKDARTELEITGAWQNLHIVVTELVPVVYFSSAEALKAYQNDHSKTEGILFSTTARKGSTLPTADAPTATREGYTFLYWSREGQTSDVTGQTVNGWTNLYANWEKIPDPTKENIEFNGKDTVYVKCDIYGTHAEPIAYGNGEYEIVRTSDTTANLVFTSATYLAASKYANDHALAAVSDPEVSTQIEFKDGKWQQLKNGPTVQVRCKVTLTYDAHAPEGKPVTNMPDPLKVTQTLDEGSATTFYLSNNIPACEGYVFLGWTSDTTLDVPTIPVEWKTENNGANWKTTTGYPGYTLYAVWQKITTPDVNEIDFSGKQIYVKCAIYDGAHGEFIDYIPGSYRIDWDGVSPKANLVFTAQSYLDASMFAGDHVLTNATQTEVSTQIVFENGQWTQKTNGPTVQVSCQAALTYNANEPAGTASNMPDPNPVKQTLTDKATKMTVIALSNKTPSLKGYKFLGWATTADAATPDYPVENMSDPTKWSITVGYEGKTLYAVWARTYSIYYDGNGGTFTKGGTDYTHVSDNDLTLGEPHTLRENVFTRDHYEFTGWAKTKEGPKDYDGGATDVTFAESDLNGKGQVKLYAQWKPVEVDVNVYIIPVDSGEEDSLLVNDVKLNAATLARIGLKAYETDEDGEAIDRILVGKYASKYAATLTADIFDEDFTDDVKTAVTNELSGFQKDADIPDAFNTNNILSNTTWTWLSVKDEENFLSGNLPLYSVRFVTEDEANVKDMPTALYSYNGAPIYDYYLKGEKVAAPTTDPSRTGYTFDGWYAPGATKKFDFATDTVTGDLVLTAKWVPETYTITYEYNDKDIKNKPKLQPQNPTSYTIEDAITLNDITAAGEHGKQFVEWRCDLDKDGVAEKITEIPKGTTGNLTISAHWNYPVNYTVFDKNGDKIDSLSKTEYVFEDVLNSKDGYKLTALTQDGYTFDGWYQDDADLGKTEKLIKDQTLRGAKKWELCGKLTPKEYTVTFNPNADDATVAPTSKLVTFDAAYDTLPTPTREGYTFEGWYLSKTEFTPANKVEATTIVKTPDDHTKRFLWRKCTVPTIKQKKRFAYMKMKESKTTMISIKYTQQDKEYLLAEAQKAGCSLSEYIREKSLQGDAILLKKHDQIFYRQLCRHNMILKDAGLSAEQQASFEAWEVATWQSLK